MFDDTKQVPADRFYLAAAIATFTSLSTLVLGVSFAKHIKDENDKVVNNTSYTVCYVEDSDTGYVIGTKDLMEYSLTKSRNVLLIKDTFYRDVYNIDDLIIIGEYPDRESAEKVAEIINRYSFETELPTLDEQDSAPTIKR